MFSQNKVIGNPIHDVRAYIEFAWPINSVRFLELKSILTKVPSQSSAIRLVFSPFRSIFCANSLYITISSQQLSTNALQRNLPFGLTISPLKTNSVCLFLGLFLYGESVQTFAVCSCFSGILGIFLSWVSLSKFLHFLYFSVFFVFFAFFSYPPRLLYMNQ